MPTLALTDSELYLLSLGAGGPIPPTVADKAKAAIARAKGLAMPARASATRKVLPVGGKGHEFCAYHEALDLPMIAGKVLCFRDTVPTAAQLEARRKWARWTSDALVKRHAAFLARPAGDGKLVGENGKRWSPAQYRAKVQQLEVGQTPGSGGERWEYLSQYRAGKLQTVYVRAPRKGKRVPSIPVSKLQSSRRRTRRSVIKLRALRDEAAA